MRYKTDFRTSVKGINSVDRELQNRLRAMCTIEIVIPEGYISHLHEVNHVTKLMLLFCFDPSRMPDQT